MQPVILTLLLTTISYLDFNAVVARKVRENIRILARFSTDLASISRPGSCPRIGPLTCVLTIYRSSDPETTESMPSGPLPTCPMNACLPLCGPISLLGYPTKAAVSTHEVRKPTAAWTVRSTLRDQTGGSGRCGRCERPEWPRSVSAAREFSGRCPTAWPPLAVSAAAVLSFVRS
jgi:hypothetical protein